MSSPVRKIDLQKFCTQINNELGTPTDPFQGRIAGELYYNTGCYYLEKRDRGYVLCRIENERGGMNSLSPCLPPRQLKDNLNMFLLGIKAGKGNK